MLDVDPGARDPVTGNAIIEFWYAAGGKFLPAAYFLSLRHDYSDGGSINGCVRSVGISYSILRMLRIASDIFTLSVVKKERILTSH